MVFNYSNITLSEAMENVLNRGLNFCVMPNKLDLTQVLMEFRKFERTMIWQEFWHGTDTETTVPIFKSNKTNLPKKHKTPPNLKIYLSSFKSEIMDPQNRQQAKSNLPPEEMKALKELISLQRDRKITIKPCDKGAGIIVLNFEAYMEASNKHLNSKTDQGEPFYTKIEPSEIVIAKQSISNLLQEIFDNGVLSKSDFEAMLPEEKHAGKFYCTFKVHKEHEHGTTPPPRPIISGKGSFTENIGKFVTHHLNEVATQHDTYIKDTPDFLRHVEALNQKHKLPKNAILVTNDVTGLFTNIPHQEGTQAAAEALSERQNPEVSTEVIIRLLELVLNNNLFEFSGETYKQLIGSAMGSSPAPPYSDMFMDRRVDKQISREANLLGQQLFLKRFLDDLFSIFVGSTKKLHELQNQINKINPNIKFTMEHTSIEGECPEERCECPERKSIPFLDTLCSIENGRIETDLYRKPTDRNKYLLLDSCHPESQVKNIPFSQFLRINRICSKVEWREAQYMKMKMLFLERKYPAGMIDSAMKRARAIPREKALEPSKAKTTTQRRPVLAVTWDPRFPSLQAINKKHWRSMKTSDQHLEKVFPEPPLIAYKRQKNIRNFVIRAKVPPPLLKYPRRNIPGMRKCQNQCHACPYINEIKEIKTETFKWKINSSVNCEDKNIIYLIECNKCFLKYIGETERSLKDRISEHKTYINQKHINQPIGDHFNKPGHSIDNFTVSVIEKVKSSEKLYRKEREKYLIKKFNTYYNGLNKNTGG